MGLYGLDRSGSGKGPVEGSCENCNQPSGSINVNKLFSRCTSGFLRMAQFHEVSSASHFSDRAVPTH
jgi:hypothetical protein